MAVFDLDFSMRQGDFTLDVHVQMEGRAVALFGPSGSGKTSVLEVIAGLRTPHRGHVMVNGHALFDSARRIDVPARGRRIGYVPQDILLFPHLGVRENVTYGLRASPRPDVSTLVDLLELTPLMDRGVASLSGGERQRVALARALYSGPEVLLLDEPLAAVDVPRRRRIVDALLGIRDELSMPLIYVTHSPNEARSVADWVVLIDNGRVVGSGSPDELMPRMDAANPS